MNKDIEFITNKVKEDHKKIKVKGVLVHLDGEIKSSIFGYIIKQIYQKNHLVIWTQFENVDRSKKRNVLRIVEEFKLIFKSIDLKQVFNSFEKTLFYEPKNLDNPEIYSKYLNGEEIEYLNLFEGRNDIPPLKEEIKSNLINQTLETLSKINNYLLIDLNSINKYFDDLTLEQIKKIAIELNINERIVNKI